MKTAKVLFFTSILVAAITMPTNVFADEQQPITVYVDGQRLNFEVSPVIQEGNTLVPFRAIFEKFGLKVNGMGVPKPYMEQKKD